MSCSQALVNKRNIDTVIAELNKSRKETSALNSQLQTALASIAALQVELNTVKQLAVRSIGRGASV